MSALAPSHGDAGGLELGTALPAFLLPILTYASFRLMRFRFPVPLLGRGALLRVPLQEGYPSGAARSRAR